MNINMRQLIIARKDLHMSPGKLAAQCCHASISFIVKDINSNTRKIDLYLHPAWTNEHTPQMYLRTDLNNWSREARDAGRDCFYAKPVNPDDPYGDLELCDEKHQYKAEFIIDNNIYEDWINGIFTKTVCEAKNRTQLLKAVCLAEELGLKENEDFFLIKDACLTELEPEEIDDNGIGRVLTCIGFRPLPDEIIQKISRKYQLYR